MRVFSPQASGTGFFVAPQRILTAAHVVRGLEASLHISFLGIHYPATIVFIAPQTVADTTAAEIHPDVALLAIDADPCGWYPVFDAGIPQTNELLSMYGFGRDASRGGDPVTAYFEGTSFHDSEHKIPVFRMKQGRFTPGFSGSAVYIEGAPSRIVGIAVETADPRFDFGGYATPVSEIVPLLQTHVPSLDVRSTAAQSPSDMEAPPPRRRSAISTAPSVRRNLQIQQLIERAERERRQFRPVAARATAQEAVELARGGAPPAVLARALRVQAIVLVSEESDRLHASALADEAVDLDNDAIADERVRALIAETTAGVEAALARITPGANAELEIIRASYLIESQVGESRRILAALPQSDADRPRARRVQVLAAIVERYQDEMVSAAQTLVSAAREDYTIAHTVITAFVLASIPTPLWPRALGSWPQPIPVSEAIDTEEQRQRLATASDLAAQVLDCSELGGDDRQLMETWRLAALALNREMRTDAVAYGQRLLDADVPNHRVLAWCEALELLPQDNIDAAIARLCKIVERGEGDAEQVLVLTITMLQRGRPAEAEAFLRTSAHLFRTVEELSRYRVLLAQSLAVQNAFEEARELQAHVSDPEDRRAIEASIRHREGPAETAHRRLYDYWRECGDPRVLISAAELAKFQGDWEFLADIGAPLLENFRNVSAARFAMYGAFNAQRYESALERYAEFRTSNIGVPADLLRIRALSLERLGNNEALPAFRELLNVAPTDENYYAAGYAYARRGDLPGTVSLGQEYIRSEDTAPDTALAYASWIRSADPDLARRLWRHAMPGAAAHDNLVLLAFRLAHQLGISDETQALQEPMQRLGREGAGGIHLVTQEEAFERIRMQSAHAADAFGRYRRGEVPIHALISATSRDLYDSHVLQPRSNAEGAAASWTPVFVRHGGRTAHGDRLDQSDVVLDATSFLLAVELNMLDILARKRRIFVSQSLGALLLSMLDDRAPENPPDRDARRRFIADVDSGRIDVVDLADEGLDAYAVDNDLTLLDWGTPANAELHAASGARWCTPMTLVDAMQRHGMLGDADRQIALRAFGNVVETGGNGPRTDDGLLARWNTAEMVYQAHLVKGLRGRTLVVQQRYVEFVRRDIFQETRREEAANWIRSAMDRLSTLISSGDITAVPDPPQPEGDPRSLELRVAFAAFSSTLPADTVIIVDDRFWTGYASRDDGKAVASLWDLVQALTGGNDGMAKERALEFSLEMRRRGLMYVPLVADEILSIVRRAPVTADQLTSSEEMRVIERYVAAALLDREALYAHGQAAAGPLMTQALFLFELSQAVRAAVAELFASGDADDELRAFWVEEHLTPDGLPGYGIAGFASGGSQGVIDGQLTGYLAQFLG